jgi:putative DNA primase/helicase
MENRSFFLVVSSFFSWSSAIRRHSGHQEPLWTLLGLFCQTWHRALDDRKQNTVNRAGYKRMLTKKGAPISSNADHHRAYGDRMLLDEAEDTELEYFVLPEVFNNEMCKGYSPKMVKKLLMNRNLLVTEGKGDEVRADQNERLPGLGNTRCYRFNSKIMSAEA